MDVITSRDGHLKVINTLSPPHGIVRGAHESDVLGRGFDLAYFLLLDRTAAIEVLTRALRKVKTKTLKDRKRAYWRDKFLKRQITRISKEDQDALQWLIYFESDRLEREQEARSQATQDDLTVRYLKTLVRISTAMSSFYVNVVVHRLLHSYSTAEAQTIYETIANTYRDADEYRRAKRYLMLKIEERFSDKLRVTRGHYGELRYDLVEDPGAYQELVHECFRLFTPWSTWGKCPVADHKVLFSDGPLDLGKEIESLGEGDRDKIEIVRCHLLIDPVCRSHLASALRLATHCSKQSIPRFHMNNRMEPPKSRRPDTPLTGAERQQMAEILQAENHRRGRVVARILFVRIDGVEIARVDLDQDREVHFSVPSGSVLLELWAEDEQGPLLLATHLMRPFSSTDSPLIVIPIGNDRRVHTKLIPPSADNPGSCAIAVDKSEGMHSNLHKSIMRLRLPPTLAAYAPALLLGATLIASWYIARRHTVAERNLVKVQTAHPAGSTLNKHSASNSLAQNNAAALSVHLTSDDLITRGAQLAPDRVITVPQTPCTIDLEIVLPGAESYHAVLTRLDNEHRILIRDIRVDNAQANVTIAVPSQLLVPGQYYRLRLQGSRIDNGRTFTFSTAATQ